MPTRTSHRVPTPLAAALGIVPAFLGHVRRLPAKAVQLPIVAVGGALTGLDNARREYESLASRGEQLVARFRRDADEVEDRFEDTLKGTPLARPYDAVEDALEDAADGVRRVLSPERSRDAAASTARTVGSRLDRAADTVEDLSTAAAEADPAARPADQLADAAERGADVVADTIDGAADVVENVVETAAGAVAGAASTVADIAGTGAEDVADTAAKGAEKVADTAGTAARAVDDAAEDVADTAGSTGAQASSLADDLAAEVVATDEPKDDVPGDEAPKGEPTAKATQPDDTRIDTAASAEVVETVEQVSSAVGAPVLKHDELPLADYDHMTLGSLRGRMRSLHIPQLVQIRDYEKAHADRLPIVTMLDNRIAKLASDPTAPLSGGSAGAPAPGQRATRRGSKVTPETSGPKVNPPSAGVPTNPQQPR